MILNNSFVRNFGLYILALGIVYFSGPYFGNFNKEYLDVGGSWIDLSDLVGFIDAYTFFIPALLMFFGIPKLSYWILGFLWIPIVLFNLYISLSVIYFPLTLALLGVGIGYSLKRLKILII
ncbi:MAG: hypothetical protein WAW81_00860 [Minisyncoccia bacterium]